MKRRQYTEEFKRDALKLVEHNGSLRGTARELSIDEKRQCDAGRGSTANQPQPVA